MQSNEIREGNVTVNEGVLVRGYGTPVSNKEGVAADALAPGTLVDGVDLVAAHGEAGGFCPRTFVLDHEGLGDTSHVDYLKGARVKVGHFLPGQRLRARVQAGLAFTSNDRLESAGDGTLRLAEGGVILARALETGPSTGRLLVEVL